MRGPDNNEMRTKPGQSHRASPLIVTADLSVMRSTGAIEKDAVVSSRLLSVE